MDITVAVCTTHDQLKFKETLCYKCLDKLDLVPEASIFYDNKMGLSECYNKVLDNTAGQDTYILFMHDDVYILDTMFQEKLELGFQKYDVLGLAGSSDFNIRRLPITWINSPKESWSGGLFHSCVSGSDNIIDLKYNFYGEFNKKCFTVDGAFIAVDRKKIGNVRFQNEFLFDFYDLAFCTECYKAGLSIGTIPLVLCHQSHGGGILKPEYKDVQDNFINKYRIT